MKITAYHFFLIFIFSLNFSHLAHAGKNGALSKKEINQQRRASRRQGAQKGPASATITQTSISNEVTNADQEELKIYDEIIADLNEFSFQDSEKGLETVYALRRFHRMNTAICHEMETTPGHTSQLYHQFTEDEPVVLRTDARPSLHGEDQTQISNSLKAINMFIMLSSAYHFAKNTENREKFDSFLEVLNKGTGCLPKRIADIDDWYQKQN